jgi:hypothetical protein
LYDGIKRGAAVLFSGILKLIDQFRRHLRGLPAGKQHAAEYGAHPGQAEDGVDNHTGAQETGIDLTGAGYCPVSATSAHRVFLHHRPAAGIQLLADLARHQAADFGVMARGVYHHFGADGQGVHMQFSQVYRAPIEDQPGNPVALRIMTSST